MNLTLLIAKREQLGFTQEQMALKLGYKDRSSYCLIENGKTRITTEIAARIKSALELTPQETIEIFFNEKVEVTQTFSA